MWRADKVSDDFTGDPETGSPDVDDAESEHAHPHVQVTAPHTLSFGEPHIMAGNVAEPTWTQWRTQISELGGRSPLIHFVDSPRTRVDLSTTHPGGLAQFITGKRTLLSSLIRDDVALRSAKTAAGAVAAKGLELATARGIDSVHLGVGIARWSHDDVEFCAPVLLRPLAIRRHGRDFELKLRGSAYLNPALARALDEQFRLRLDAESFVALADADGTFKPNPVIDRLRGLTSHLDAFAVSPRLVVSSFADVAHGLAADAEDLQHPILDALAGNTAAAWTIKEGYAPVPALSADERSPQTDNLLLDADAEQENVIAQIEAGNSLVVRTLPGTGGTQTIVNAVGALVAQNKRVLVVSPRRASLQSIADRFADIGLPGLSVAPRTLRRDIIRSISRSEKASKPQIEDVDDALLRLRKIMLDYRESMSVTDGVLGVSVLDCVSELSRLALLPTPPSTTARLSREAVEKLAKDRSTATGVIIAAAKLGEFKYGPGDSPWYGAQFANGGEALKAHQVAQRVNSQLSELLGVANRLVSNTRMRPFQSIDELGVYLRLLVDLRETLDRFVPTVFDRAITELIAATAPRRDFPEMTGANRRRLKKLALEYVRPGVRVPDMHGALKRIQKQRVLWHRFVAEGASPAVPVGIGEVQRSYQQVSEDLALLDIPLGIADSHVNLSALPIPFLIEKVASLAAESDVLNNLQERTALMGSLRDLKLDPLIEDLAERHVPQDQVAAELELSWWKSALDSMLEVDRALLNANTTVVDRLEADFRLVDEAHASANAKQLSWQIAENWKIGLVDWPDEASALKRALAKDRLTSFDVQTSAPHLSRTIAPVWLASPYEIDSVVDTMPFDTLLLVDAGAVTVAEAAGAIRRSKQVIVIGDPVIQSPTPFDTAVRDATGDLPQPVSDEIREALVADSAFAKLSGLLPTLTLTRSYRPGGEELAELVNRRFYDGQIESLPWAGSFLGHGSLAVSYVADGVGMPDPDSGAVESPDAEVSRVVELVLDHATKRPQESLMVITASPVHSVRVMQAVLDAVSRRRPELLDVIIGDRAEPFTVTTIDQAVAQSRDRVIFSIGYGRTPHGRVLSDFGSLGEPGGERLLAVAMTRARRSLEIVTSFRSEDLDDGRMKHGAVALAEVLDEVDARYAEVPVPDDSDPMLVDLARRLEARGLRVALGHRAKLGLVASRGGRCGTIETDAMVHESSLRESLRLRPELLRRLGWHYLRVHAFELFSDPDQVADKVARMLGAEPAPTTEPITIVPAQRPQQ
ncbi:AAA family ATPase [Salinibacterium sp. UTAS2018]|uniref:DEAD/DEAH box helicase n=1 Tax=Salinibacterium sp. UTAS2018 TaxID=2508880 RepID=UPI0010094889|nr:AAA family ATPase [Salinibacterium sp. UTAS2018]